MRFYFVFSLIFKNMTFFYVPQFLRKTFFCYFKSQISKWPKTCEKMTHFYGSCWNYLVSILRMFEFLPFGQDIVILSRDFWFKNQNMAKSLKKIPGMIPIPGTNTRYRYLYGKKSVWTRHRLGIGDMGDIGIGISVSYIIYLYQNRYEPGIGIIPIYRARFDMGDISIGLNILLTDTDISVSVKLEYLMS